jgi:hypothetical protein
MIDGTILSIKREINYLGVTLSDKSGKSHTFNRIRSCRKAFFSLQGVGMCKNGLEPSAMAEIWNKCCRPVLTYGCESVSLSAQNQLDIIKLQAKLIKSALGIKQCTRNKPLLDTLKVTSATNIIENNSLCLLRNTMCNDSRARKFYSSQIYYAAIKDKCIFMNQKDNLVTRVKQICERRNVSFIKCILDKTYFRNVCNETKYKAFTPSGTDGYIDSLRGLLSNFNCTNRDILFNMLKCF